MVEVAPGVLVNPAHVRKRTELPGGWGLPAGDLPRTRRLKPDDQVALGLVHQEGRWWWATAGGLRPGPGSLQEGLARHPDLVKAGRWHLRPGAVRALRREGRNGLVTLEGGVEAKAPWAGLEGLARALGLPWPDLLGDVPARHRPVYERGLRDWPVELLRRERRWLRDRYRGDPLRLVDEVIWEALRRHAAGEEGSTSPRGLFYNPLKSLAQRAGVLGAGAGEDLEGWVLAAPLVALWLASLGAERRQASTWRARRPAAGERWSPRRFWRALQARLDLFVGEWRVATFKEFGFADRGKEDRRIGGRRPRVVLVVEKESLARAIHEAFGVTVFVTGGLPPLVGAEFLVRDLEALGVREVLLLSFCDFDPVGWDMPTMFAPQLERYGMVVREIRRLVTPERFTEEELRRLSVPLDPSRNPIYQSRLRRWMRETGGVLGQRRGIHADHLLPVARVLQAVLAVAGDWLRG